MWKARQSALEGAAPGGKNKPGTGDNTDGTRNSGGSGRVGVAAAAARSRSEKGSVDNKDDPEKEKVGYFYF